MKDGKGEILIYKAQDGHASIEVSLEHGTVWLTQQQIADLFETQRPAITRHLGNIFKSNELSEDSVSSILEHTAALLQKMHYLAANSHLNKSHLTPKIPVFTLTKSHENNPRTIYHPPGVRCA